MPLADRVFCDFPKSGVAGTFDSVWLLPLRLTCISFLGESLMLKGIWRKCILVTITTMKTVEQSTSHNCQWYGLAYFHIIDVDLGIDVPLWWRHWWEVWGMECVLCYQWLHIGDFANIRGSRNSSDFRWENRRFLLKNSRQFTSKYDCKHSVFVDATPDIWENGWNQLIF